MNSHVGRHGVDTELFQQVILHGYVLDGSYAFLDQRHSLAFAEMYECEYVSRSGQLILGMLNPKL